jgi:uncharacterized protein involved in outer membrane biogenesis
MIAARQVGRWTLYVLGGLVAAVVLARVGLGIYFSTAAGKAFVARQITAKIGLPVAVHHVRLGLLTSSIGLTMFDPSVQDPSKAEILTIENADADISLFNLAAGSVSPSRVDLEGVNLILHVSADGEVITTLPILPEGSGAGRVPANILHTAKITVRQDARPEFALNQLALAVEPAADAVKVSGTIDDPKWSKWTISGHLPRQASTGWIEAAAENTPLAMSLLESVPFVPPEVWKSVRPDGHAAATLRLWSDPRSGVQYSIDLRPHGAALTLPDASVTLTDVTGSFHITGSKIQVADAHAGLAGGQVAVTGNADFGTDPVVVDLDVTGKDLDVSRFPPEWRFPKELQGKLSGRADLAVKIHSDGRFEPSGSGEGTLTGVTVLGFPGEDIPIRLRQTGKKYEFYQPKKVAIAAPRRAGSVSDRSIVSKAAALDPILVMLLALPPVADAPGSPEFIVQQPQPKDPAQPQDDQPLTLDATIRLRDIDIAQLLERLKVKLDYRIAGQVSVEATIAVPIAEATSTSAIRFDGKISSPELTLEGLTIRDVTANLVYHRGTFTLTELSGRIDQPEGGGEPGSFRGAFKAETEPPGDVSASLVIDRIPVGEVLRAVPDLALSASGTVSGKVEMKAPYEKASDLQSWQGSASVTSGELVVEGRRIKGIQFAAVMEKGRVTLSEGSLALEGIPVTAEGQLNLTGKYSFSAVIRTTGTSVTDLQRLVPEVKFAGPIEGVLDTTSNISGTLSPLDFKAAGTIAASKLTLGKSTANRIDARWELTAERFAVPELKAEAFGGTVTGSAEVPLAADKTGKFEVNFKSLDSAAATRLIPDFPVRLTGEVSGKIAGTIAPPKPGASRIGTLDVDLTAPKLTVQGFPAERLVGKAEIKGGVIAYALEGRTLGGSFDIKGRYPGQKQKKDAKEPADRGSLRLTGINLARLAPEIGFESLKPLAGRLDAAFDFANDFSEGSGRLILTRLQWGREVVAEELTGVLLLRDGIVQLAEMNGRLAGGELRLRGRVRLQERGRNFFTLTLRGAEAKQLLAPFLESSDLIDGPLTLVVHASLGGETRGSGTVTLERGTVAGVAVTGLRVPFEFATTSYGYGRFSVREASVHAGNGRARGQFTINWGYTARVDGQILFNNVPIRTLAPGLGENALVGNGRITGRFDLHGSNVRSVDDLTGTLLARLNNTSVKEVPILQQAAPFLNAYQLTRPFDSGDVRGVLRQGVFHVQRLALANPGAQIFAEGTIRTSGQIDLDVVAHTGTIGPQVRALRLFGLRIPAFGPLPLTLLRDVSDFLSNRTIRMTITGSVDNPIVRVNARALLTEQAVRFFLARYVLPADVAGAIGLGAGTSER